MDREGSTPPDNFPLVVSQMILLRCVNCVFGIHFYERKGAWERSEKCWVEHNIKLMSLAHEYLLHDVMFAPVVLTEWLIKGITYY